MRHLVEITHTKIDFISESMQVLEHIVLFTS